MLPKWSEVFKISPLTYLPILYNETSAIRALMPCTFLNATVPLRVQNITHSSLEQFAVFDDDTFGHLYADFNVFNKHLNLNIVLKERENVVCFRSS